MTFQSLGICVSDYRQIGIAFVLKPPNNYSTAAALVAKLSVDWDVMPQQYNIPAPG